MTSNLVGGWFQRLDRLHKYAFGSVVIAGEDNDQIITGVWVFRGADIPAEMKECDDSELYEWARADLANPEHKKRLEDLFAWDATYNGKPFKAGKNFK
eukprot:TRINITY_DN200_c0_g1_i8.p2 TRINITY_DN200_c0_g1~~TRINITY_DN200_c0_g1_i8.p2  ORF type:complete len:98 (+),score=61.27 TRINITY_DN200_c0_g1_i8:409-702(+)